MALFLFYQSYLPYDITAMSFAVYPMPKVCLCLLKGFSFHGFCTFLNSAQLASWAKFKNVQNLHQSNVTPWKKTL